MMTMNVKTARLLVVLSLLVCTALIAACDGSKEQAAKAPQIAVPVVTVIPSKDAPEKRIISNEVIPQPNCGGTSTLSNTVERSHSVAHTLEVIGGASVNASGEVGVPGVAAVQVGAEVAAQYGLTYGQQETLSRSLTVAAKEGTNMRHTIQQVEYWETGEIVIAVGDNKLPPYSYRFRKDFGVEPVQSENIGCPSPTPDGSASLMAAPTEPPTETPAPSSTPTLTPTPTNTSTATLSPTLTAESAAQPTLATVRADVAGGAKAVGESYVANGIQLGLVGYSIDHDGTVSLKFSVKNETNQKLLLRYKNSYFSVRDDTGKAHPQSEDNLLDLKQAELASGDSFELSSSGYTNEWNKIGYFAGKVPEAASQLIVKVSQFADLRDLPVDHPTQP